MIVNAESMGPPSTLTPRTQTQGGPKSVRSLFDLNSTPILPGLSPASPVATPVTTPRKHPAGTPSLRPPPNSTPCPSPLPSPFRNVPGTPTELRKRPHESASSGEESLECKRMHAGETTPQPEAKTDMEQGEAFTEVNNRNRSSHKEGSSKSGQKHSGGGGGGKPTNPPGGSRDPPSSILYTYIMFSVIQGFQLCKLEGFVSAFRGFIVGGGGIAEAHAPFRKLGPAFKIPRSKLEKAKSSAFPGMDLKYVTGNNLREMRTNGSTQTKKSGTKTDRSYAILNIATTVREERLRELFDFKLYSIRDAKRVQIKGKETELMKLTVDTAVPPFEL